MIARLWTPLRAAVSGVAGLPELLAVAPPVALAVAGLCDHARDPVGAATVWLALGALGFAATRGARAAPGPYAASAATGLVWEVAALALAGAVGAAGAGGAAGFVVLAALSATLGAVVLAERRRTSARVGGAASEVGPSGGALSDEPVAGPELWRSRSARVAISCAVLVGGGVVGMGLLGVGPPGAGAVGAAPWMYLVVFALLVQRLAPLAFVAAGAVAGGVLAFALGASLASPLVGLAIGWALPVRASLTTPLVGRAVEAYAGVLVLALVAAVALESSAEASAAACIVAGGSGLGALAGAWFDRVRAPVRGAGGPLATVRRGLGRLDPYPRWYGAAKLATDPVYGWLADSVQRWGRVLDVGAGMGLASAVAATRESTASLTLVDLDAEKLSAACELLRALGRSPGGVELLAGVFPTSAPPTGRFDTVLVIDVLHYLDREAAAALLRAAAERLAPGGRLLVRDPVAAAPAAGEAPPVERPVGEIASGRIATGEVARMERWTMRFGFNPVGLARFATDAQWRELFRRSGLVEVERVPCGRDNVLFVLASADDELGQASAARDLGASRGRRAGTAPRAPESL